MQPMSDPDSNLVNIADIYSVEYENHHSCAKAGESQRNGFAYTSLSARDQCHFVF
jgi:hypothetical protein